VDVLIVEQDADVQETLCDCLEDDGYRCARVDEVPTALGWLGMHPERLVVVVVGNFAGVSGTGPFDGGVPLLRALDAHEPFWGRHGVVGLVALPQHLPADIHDVCARRHVSLLPKPFDVLRLLETVADCARALVAGPSPYVAHA
jgi:CheY-like chemotaxis protein